MKAQTLTRPELYQYSHCKNAVKGSDVGFEACTCTIMGEVA